MTYEVLWCVNQVDIRDLPDAIGFAMPFLVGIPGEAKVLGVFPERMGRGYARQFEKSMTGLGLSSAVSFYVTEVPHVVIRPVLNVLEMDGQPIGLSEGSVSMANTNARAHRCVVGRLYYEGVGH